MGTMLEGRVVWWAFLGVELMEQLMEQWGVLTDRADAFRYWF